LKFGRIEKFGNLEELKNKKKKKWLKLDKRINILIKNKCFDKKVIALITLKIFLNILKKLFTKSKKIKKRNPTCFNLKKYVFKIFL